VHSHQKTREIDSTKPLLTVIERRRVLAVVTSKFAAQKSRYPPTASKVKVAQMLSEITRLPQAALSDSVTRRSYVNTFLEKLRCKLSPSKRRYSRQKLQLHTELPSDKAATFKENVQVELDDDSSFRIDRVNNVGISFEGCSCGLPACTLCEGMI
jgi:hypothetical protein